MGRLGRGGGAHQTIGLREIALGKWAAEKARKLEDKERLYFKPEDMGDLEAKYVDTALWLTKDETAWFFTEQRKGESNGQTLARLIREGNFESEPV